MSKMVKNYKDIKDGVEETLRSRSVIINRRGNKVIPRRYHMTDDQVSKLRRAWSEAVSDVSSDVRSKADPFFFNPYRPNGAYYGAVQSLFLLGANEWHSFGKVRGKMQEDMSTRISSSSDKNSWEKFALRGAREGAVATKDLMGRIVQNFRTLQRLGGVNPYGFKLKQLCSSVDIKRESDGIWHFRLNTSWDNIDSVAPHYDISAYVSAQKIKKKTLASVGKNNV